jgi:hypothetical protein
VWDLGANLWTAATKVQAVTEAWDLFTLLFRVFEEN